MKAKFKFTNRILSLVLALVMVVGMLPMMSLPAYAEVTSKISQLGITLYMYQGYCEHNEIKPVHLLRTDPSTGVNEKFRLTYEYSGNDLVIEYYYSVSHVGYSNDGVRTSFTIPNFSCENNYNNRSFTTANGSEVTFSRSAGHAVSSWTDNDNGTHSGNCLFCGAVTENCTYSKATCTTPATCTACGGTTGGVDASAHSWGDWTYSEDGKHIRTCTLNSAHTESGNCSYSAATCLAASACSVCEYKYAAQLEHSYTYTANGSVLTEKCDNGCGHTATAKLEYKTGDGTYSYTGSAITPVTIDYSGNWQGEKPTDISYVNNVDVGTAKGTLTFGDVTIEKTFEISQADIADAIVTFDSDNATYNGNEQKPTVHVGYGGITLSEGTDYTISWDKSELIDVDSYTATLTGIGNFKGTTTKTFGINPKEVSFSWHGNNFMAYTGHLVLPRVSISGLADGDSCEAIVEVVETVDGAGINPGKWTARITGLTNKNYKLPENNQLIEAYYTIYANQNAPAVFGVDETIKGKNDGYISGLTTEMEYATEPTSFNSAYTKITDPHQIFAPGTYYVRYAAKDYYYSSKYTKVTIAQGRALTVTLPSENEQIGYTIAADKTALSYGDSVSITIKYKDGYSRSERFAVYSNGVDVTDKFNFANDTLTLTNIKEDIEITLANGSIADTTAPTAEITLGTNKWNSFLNEITFGLFFNKTQTVTINANDNGSGIDKIYYHLSNEQLSEDDINTITDWKEYNNAFNINPDNKYVVYAKIVDKAGNVAYISSDGLVLDGTGPVVLGMENGAVYHGMNVFDVKDELSDIASIKIDSEETTFAPFEPAICIMPDDKEHTVEVTDKAGNTTTYTVTVYKVYTVTFIAEGEAGSYEKPVKYGEVITIPTNDIFEDTFRKPGYTLTDWNGYTQGMKMPLKNLTFTAVYTPNDYTVEFDPNGGEAIAPVTVTFGEKYGRLPSSAITGLSGGDSNWYLVDQYGNLTDTKITKLTKVSQPRNHTLFIKRSVLAPTVKLTLSVPGGISDSYQYYIPGASQRVLTATIGNMNTDVLDYTYKWYKDGELINGESTDVLTLDGNVSDSGTYKVEVTAKLKNGVNIVVTADTATASKEQKVKILHATNTLSYDANGGEGGPQSSYTGGTTLTVSKDTPTREYSVFLGWNTKADGTGENYKAEDVYTFADDNSNGGCTTTLYAQWKLVEYTVTYTADGKDVSTENVEHGKNANLPAVPAKDGFVGKWDSDGKNITSDTTISAIYTAIPVVNPDEVKPQDKNDLEDTKEKLEEELKDNSYTEDDKKDIQDAIDDINDALKVIENVENVENLIDDIPSIITKDDKAAINAAVDAYNALTDYEKSLVDKNAKKALDDAKAELSKLYKSTDTKSPQTSDNSLIFLWFALLLIGSASVLGFSYTNHKRKSANKNKLN